MGEAAVLGGGRPQVAQLRPARRHHQAPAPVHDLADPQSRPDDRDIAIDQVGLIGLHYPITVLDRAAFVVGMVRVAAVRLRAENHDSIPNLAALSQVTWSRPRFADPADHRPVAGPG